MTKKLTDTQQTKIHDALLKFVEKKQAILQKLDENIKIAINNYKTEVEILDNKNNNFDIELELQKV